MQSVSSDSPAGNGLQDMQGMLASNFMQKPWKMGDVQSYGVLTSAHCTSHTSCKRCTLIDASGKGSIAAAFADCCAINGCRPEH